MNADGKTMAESASTWIQVAFGGLGLAVTMVAAVVAYFAWARPQAPGEETAPDGRPPATNTTVAEKVPLTDLEPVLGGGNVRRDGRDLTLPCATGRTTDRPRTVEYDLLGHYTAAAAGITVSEARDDDARFQVTVLTDGLVAATVTVIRAEPGRLDVPLTGKQKLRIQLTCEFPDGGITMANPTLTPA